MSGHAKLGVYFTLPQVCEALQIHERTCRSYIASGALRVVRLSPRCLRVTEADLAAFVESRRTPARGAR